MKGWFTIFYISSNDIRSAISLIRFLQLHLSTLHVFHDVGTTNSAESLVIMKEPINYVGTQVVYDSVLHRLTKAIYPRIYPKIYYRLMYLDST